MINANCACVYINAGLLTWLNFKVERVLLLDGVSKQEASVAAVVSRGILGQDIGEVKVTVQPHGDPVVLGDRQHSLREKGSQNDNNILQLQ